MYRHPTYLVLALMFAPLGACPSEAPERTVTVPTTPAVTAPTGYRVVASVDTPGSIAGTIRYAGSLQDTPVAVDRDKTTCASAGEVTSGALVVKEGGVANAVIEVVGVTAGLGFQAQTIKVDNVGCMFVPRVALAHVGDTFISHNSDPVFHNAKLDRFDGSRTKRIANLPVPLQGTDSPARILKKPGIVKVSCDAHQWMRSTVYVTEHPYTALSDADGRFSLGNLPAGEYTLIVWHEVLGRKETTVTVPRGETATINVSF